MLRHVTRDEVTVFVALKSECTVSLNVYRDIGLARTMMFTGSRTTVKLGAHLHVVAVTARTHVASQVLLPETTYFYDLDFGPGFRTLGAKGVLAPIVVPLPFAYLLTDLPSFALPPAALDKVRFVHASCRKPHGESLDALPGLDDMIKAAAEATTPSFALGRPHQLYLTGDQIYADDVADALLFMLRDAATTLLGWPAPEALPKIAVTPIEIPPPTAASLAPGARAKLTLSARTC
jgi:hypothetical protein